METWEYVEGYNNDNDYTDNSVHQVDIENKTISIINKQTLLVGERNSQYLVFQIPRFYDGIDLSSKNIGILYSAPSGFMDMNKPINVRRNDEFLNFGWLIPPEATDEQGVLSFCVEFYSDNYSLKTKTDDLNVEDTMQGEGAVSEPTEQSWYAEIQSRCDTALTKAEEILNEHDELETMIDDSGVLE